MSGVGSEASGREGCRAEEKHERSEQKRRRLFARSPAHAGRSAQRAEGKEDVRALIRTQVAGYRREQDKRAQMTKQTRELDRLRAGRWRNQGLHDRWHHWSDYAAKKSPGFVCNHSTGNLIISIKDINLS